MALRLHHHLDTIPLTKQLFGKSLYFSRSNTIQRFDILCCAVEAFVVIIIQCIQPVAVFLLVFCMTFQDIVLRLFEIFGTRADVGDTFQFVADDCVHLFAFARIGIEVSLQEGLSLGESGDTCRCLYTVCSALFLAYLFHINKVEYLLQHGCRKDVFQVVIHLTGIEVYDGSFRGFHLAFETVDVFAFADGRDFFYISFFNFTVGR